MNNIKFKKVTMISKKLDKEIDLECYTEENGETIVSTNSLKRAFESIKKEFGITDSIKTASNFSERGTLTYACVEWRLKDKDGYDSTFIGESTLLNMDSLVAKKYPMTTALNRAQSAGIISYLQLPGKIYSDAQRPIQIEDCNSTTDTNTDMNKKDKNNATSSVAGIITSVPEMPKDAADAEPEVNNSEIKTETTSEQIKSIENKIEKESSEETSIANVLADAEREENVTSVVIPNEDELPFNDEDEYSEVEPETNMPNNTNTIEDVETNVINEDEQVGIGVFANVTIKDFIRNYNEKKSIYVKFVQMYKEHKIQIEGTEKANIMNYIVAHVA